MLRRRRDVHGLVESEELAERAEELRSRSLIGQRVWRAGRTGDLRRVPRLVAVEVDGRAFDVRLHVTEPPWAELAPATARARGSGAAGGGDGAVVSPMQGTVLKVEVADGDEVADRAGALRRRGDEDGERDRRAARRRRHRPRRRSRRGHRERSADLRRRRAGRRDASRRSSQRLVGDETLTGATLSRPRTGDPSEPSRVTVAPVDVRDGLALALPTALRDADDRREPRRRRARRARLATAARRALPAGAPARADADWQVLARARRAAHPPPAADPPDGDASRTTAPSGASSPRARPVPFLVELGVMTPEGKVRAPRRDKFRQVNRFVELVEDVLPSLPSGDLRVVDFGSGKSYLTFALHDLLVRRPRPRGRDRRPRPEGGRRRGVRGARPRGSTPTGSGSRSATSQARRPRRRRSRRQPARLRHGDRRRARPGGSRRRAGDPRRAVLPARAARPARERRRSRPLLRHGTLRERFAAEVTDAARAQLLGARRLRRPGASSSSRSSTRRRTSSCAPSHRAAGARPRAPRAGSTGPSPTRSGSSRRSSGSSATSSRA